MCQAVAREQLSFLLVSFFFHVLCAIVDLGCLCCFCVSVPPRAQPLSDVKIRALCRPRHMLHDSVPFSCACGEFSMTLALILCSWCRRRVSDGFCVMNKNPNIYCVWYMCMCFRWNRQKSSFKHFCSRATWLSWTNGNLHCIFTINEDDECKMCVSLCVNSMWWGWSVSSCILYFTISPGCVYVCPVHHHGQHPHRIF